MAAMSTEPTLEEMWRTFITGKNPAGRKGWRLRRML